jgi:transposase
MILLPAARVSISDIARTVGISRRFIYKWAKRFLPQGLEGLADAKRPGRRLSPLAMPPDVFPYGNGAQGK